MGFFRNYRQRRVSLTGPESIDTLTAIERFFQGGRNWTRGAYHRADGTKCMVGAVQSVGTSAINDARYWLRQAIAERHPGWLPVMQIERFNDSHSFAEVTAVIKRAKQLAAAAAARPAAGCPAPAAEILPPSRSLPPQRRAALTYQPETEAVLTLTDELAQVAKVAIKHRDRNSD